MKTPQLTPGIALVLFGGQASGKSALAREIAATHGSYKECRIDDLRKGPFRFADLLAHEVAVLIIDGTPRAQDLPLIKTILCSPDVAIEERGKPGRLVLSPHLIFCVEGNWPSVPMTPDRRFQYHRMQS